MKTAKRLVKFIFFWHYKFVNTRNTYIRKDKKPIEFLIDPIVKKYTFRFRLIQIYNHSKTIYTFIYSNIRSIFDYKKKFSKYSISKIACHRQQNKYIPIILCISRWYLKISVWIHSLRFTKPYNKKKINVVETSQIYKFITGQKKLKRNGCQKRYTQNYSYWS